MSWDPRQYLRFAGPRMQPGIDLIGRIPEIGAGQVVDLGSGTGYLTSLLAKRWPSATVIGVDRASQMLERAAEDYPADDWPSLGWQCCDIEAWQAETPPDLIFSNAALQWLDHHETLFPSLIAQLAPGGVLAVQMPRNYDQPSHVILRDLAEEAPWTDRIPLRDAPVMEPQGYYDLLAAHSASLQIWETEYLHVLTGENPVLNWLRGTALVPVLEALSGDELEAFLAACGKRLDQAYPRRPDGQTLFPFRRVFLLAVRP